MTRKSYIQFQREHSWGVMFDLDYSPAIVFPNYKEDDRPFREPHTIHFSAQFLCFAVFSSIYLW